MLKTCWNWLRRSSTMADHTELISEFPVVEKMTTQDRLKHAKKRRLHQLKMWSQREKDFATKKHKTTQNTNKKQKNIEVARVHFESSVMVLEAAARNDVDEVRRLLLLGVNPDSTNEDGLTALHQCCIDDSEEMMKVLLEFGANINAEDSERWTPLHAAATCGHLNLAKYLINKGANLLAVNADGNMPYDICEDEKTLDYIEAEMAKRGVTQQLIDETRAATEMQMLQDLKQLLESNGNIDFQEEIQGATALHIASANGYVVVVEFLLDNGANFNLVDNDSWQPIHAAACWGHPDIVELLAQHGADLNVQTKNGETPHDICEDPELKERILELKNEMEIKKLSQQSAKLRRSQSQNTRSQSVRRTSLRDKSQISWKEAREEAKMRLEQQEKFFTFPDNSKEPAKTDDRKIETVQAAVSIEDVTIVVPTTVNVKEECSTQMKSCAPNEISSPKETKTTKDETSERRNATEEETTTTNEVDSLHQVITAKHNGTNAEVTNVVVNNGSSIPEDADNVNKSTTTPSSQHDLKVDLSIHVTVNAQYNNNGGGASMAASCGTLPDLKRQRTDLRNRTNSVISTTSLDDHWANGVKGKGEDGNYIIQVPPTSPSRNRHRFSSGPTEVIGGGSEKRGCCEIM